MSGGGLKFFRLRRVLKGTLVTAALGGTLYTLHRNEWDVSSIGAVRIARAAFTVSRIALDYKISTIGIHKDSEEYAEKRSQVHQRSAERLLHLCSVNGGVYIKVGQHVGALDYLLPPEYTKTLSVLHSRAPASSMEDVLRVLREDLHAEPSEVFSSISERPIGAASLAQVHQVTLKETGEKLAVKVQHRRVQPHSRVDMATMELLVNIVAKVFPEFTLMWLADETKRNLPVELDFIHEGHNTERVKNMFKHFKWLKVPDVRWDLTSKRVLTMEFCEGGQVNDKEYLTKQNISASQVSERLGKLYSEMIFVHGYVHCDPHPGNLLIQPGSDGPTLVLLDHGLYTELTNKFRLQYARLWLALLRADVNTLKVVGGELGVRGDLYKILMCIISGRSWTAVSEGIDKRKTSAKEGQEIRDFASEHFTTISQILNMVPREMLLIFKTNDLLRGIETMLGTRGASKSFMTMSRCCIRAVYDEQLRLCSNMWCKFNVQLRSFLTGWSLTAYEMYCWMRSTRLATVLLGCHVAP
ncbi:aarF domain-containing protein kinase 1-like isoform X2 [Ornithodoros turicata]